MTRKISSCVVFVTLIWSASTENEEKIRDIFKSNMTRNDFSGLLQSLIKLNERRVSVLQKLYRLEDYGVISEVLRSGDKKVENENPNNLFLIVMSKNKTNPLIYMGFDGMDSLIPLNSRSNKLKTSEKRSRNLPKNVELVKDPAGFIENIRKIIIKDIPKFYGPKQINLTDGRSKKIITTKKPLKHLKRHKEVKEKTSYFNLSRAPKVSRKANYEKQGKENSRFEIVNNNVRSNINQEHPDYNDNSNNYPPTFVDNGQNNQYPEIKFSFPMYSPDNSKFILEGNDKAEDIFSSLSKEMNMEIGGNNQFRKINIDSNIKNDQGNDPKSNKNNSMKNLQGNQYFELNLDTSIDNNQDNKYYKMKADLARKLEERINGNMNRKVQDNASEQIHTVKSKRLRNKHPKLIREKTKANDTERQHLALTIKHKNATRVKKRNNKNILSLPFMSSETLNGNTIPNKTEDSVNKNLQATKDRKDIINNPEKDNPKTAKPYEEKPPDEKPKAKDNGGEENSETTKINTDKSFNTGPTNVGRERPEDNKQLPNPISNVNQPISSKPNLRNTYKKQMKRRAEKICSKSCISAYKIVCRRLKCSSKAKRSLKKECKRSCRKTFAASGSSSSGDCSDESERHYWFRPNLH